MAANNLPGNDGFSAGDWFEEYLKGECLKKTPATPNVLPVSPAAGMLNTPGTVWAMTIGRGCLTVFTYRNPPWFLARWLCAWLLDIRWFKV